MCKNISETNFALTDLRFYIKPLPPHKNIFQNPNSRYNSRDTCVGCRGANEPVWYAAVRKAGKSRLLTAASLNLQFYKITNCPISYFRGVEGRVVGFCRFTSLVWRSRPVCTVGTACFWRTPCGRRVCGQPTNTRPTARGSAVRPRPRFPVQCETRRKTAAAASGPRRPPKWPRRKSAAASTRSGRRPSSRRRAMCRRRRLWSTRNRLCRTCNSCRRRLRRPWRLRWRTRMTMNRKTRMTRKTRPCCPRLRRRRRRPRTDCEGVVVVVVAAAGDDGDDGDAAAAVDGDGGCRPPRTATGPTVFSSTETEAAEPVAAAVPDLQRNVAVETCLRLHRRTHHRHHHLHGSTMAQRPPRLQPPSIGTRWRWPRCPAACRWRARWPRPLAAPWPRTSGPCTRRTATPSRSSAVCPSSADSGTTPETIFRLHQAVL